MPPRVAITPHGLSIDGRTRLLYGGEVQYYRIRDKARDPAATHSMWVRSLDHLVAADMNLVTAYVPWDVHEPERGQWRFDGCEDLDRFLALCHERELVTVVKPGPFINSEWPTGIGSFGAVPAWFLREHPDTLALRPNGKPFTVDILGSKKGRQPSYFAPQLLEACERWFAQLAPIFRRYMTERPTVFGLQIDNETNFYFSDRYTVDYSEHGLRQYRTWLEARYGDVDALNAAYGTAHASFDAVDPPRRAPAKGAPLQTNRWHQDWFAAGRDGIADYQLALRAIWERLGISEPDVLFFTNDSPHTMPAELGREHLTLWDGPTKNRAGVAMLDAYPKQFPTTQGPLDVPFLTGYFSKRFARSNDGYAFAGGEPVVAGKCYAAEIEGGLFELPFLQVALPVPDATTDQLLLQHVGRGSVLANIYIFQAGLNRDDTKYFQEAAIQVDGTPGSRYAVLQRWGRALRACGDALRTSQPVEAPVALAVDARFMGPAAGVHEHPGRVQVNAACALFGLLEDAGLDPAVIDLQSLQPGELEQYGLVVFPNPDVVHTKVTAAFRDYVEGGGHLVSVLGLGRFDQDWQRGTSERPSLADGLFGDARLDAVWHEKGVLGKTLSHANVNVRIEDGPQGALRVGPYLARYTLSGDATPIAWDRTFPLGKDGPIAAWTASKGAGRVTQLGTNPAQVHATSAYYGAAAADLLTARELALWIAAQAGVAPIASVRDAAATCWARRSDDATFLFVCGRLDREATVHVDVHDLPALGLEPESRYTVRELLYETDLAPATGRELAERGLELTLPAYGAALIRLLPM